MRKFLFVGLLPLALTSCHQPPPRQCLGGSDVQVQVRSPLDDSSNRSIALSAGEAIQGAFRPTGALRVDAVAVQIGNDAGAADGDVAFRLCQDGRCVEGKTSLKGSRDNEYLQIPLTPHLGVTFEAGVISYELTRLSGAGEMVAWAYPGVGGQTSMQLKDGGTGEVLNLMLHQH